MLRTRSIYYYMAAPFLALLVALTGCAGDGDKDGRQTAESTADKGAIVAREGYQVVEVKGITFQWKTSDASLEGVLEAETDGWIAVGFDPSKGMQDANIIIGYVEDSTVFIRDDFGTWLTSHADDEELGGTKDDFKGMHRKKGKTEIRL